MSNMQEEKGEGGLPPFPQNRWEKRRRKRVSTWEKRKGGAVFFPQHCHREKSHGKRFVSKQTRKREGGGSPPGSRAMPKKNRKRGKTRVFYTPVKMEGKNQTLPLFFCVI